MPRPLYPRERQAVSIVQKAGWAPGPVWMGPRTGLDGCGSLTTPGLFFIITYSVLHPYLFLCLDCPACCLSAFTVQHRTQTCMTPGGIRTRHSASDRPQTLALDRSVPGIGFKPETVQPVEPIARRNTDWLSYPGSYVQCVHDSISYLVYVCDNSVSVRPLTTFPTTQLTPWSAVFLRTILPQTTNRNPSTSTKSWSLSCATRIPSHTRHCFLLYCRMSCLAR